MALQLWGKTVVLVPPNKKKLRKDETGYSNLAGKPHTT